MRISKIVIQSLMAFLGLSLVMGVAVTVNAGMEPLQLRQYRQATGLSADQAYKTFLEVEGWFQDVRNKKLTSEDLAILMLNNRTLFESRLLALQVSAVNEVAKIKDGDARALKDLESDLRNIEKAMAAQIRQYNLDQAEAGLVNTKQGALAGMMVGTLIGFVGRYSPNLPEGVSMTSWIKVKQLLRIASRIGYRTAAGYAIGGGIGALTSQYEKVKIDVETVDLEMSSTIEEILE